MTPKNKERSLSNYSRLANPHSLSSHGGDVLALLESRQPPSATPTTTKQEYSPEQFARDHLVIQDKSRRFVPLEYKKAQRHFLANRTGRDLVLKARQIGFSTAIQAEFFRLYTTHAHSALTIADVQGNTDKMRRMAERFYERLPSTANKPIRSEANAIVTVYPHIGSEVAIATAGAQTAGRASTYTLFHGSEVAYWRNADWVISGALQAVPEHLADTWVVFESTANGASGWFYRECMKALKGESEWKLHFYAWWWDEDYQTPLRPGETIDYTPEEAKLVQEHGLSPEQIKWRRKKVNDLKEEFQKEYPESPKQAFLTTGGGVFVLRAQNIADGMIEERLENYETMYKTRYEYRADCLYVAGLDWGQENDYTALSIMELKAGEDIREVYCNRWNKQSWAMIRSHVIEALLYWHVEKLLPERNSMTANIEGLSKELEEAGYTGAIQPFNTGQFSKDVIVKHMQNGLNEHGLLLLPLDYANDELTSYIKKQSPVTKMYSYEAAENGHDDTVMARMLAYYGASQLWI
jgi:hypothetical protein